MNCLSKRESKTNQTTRYVLFLSFLNIITGNYLYYIDQLILHYITGGDNQIEGKTLASLKTSKTANKTVPIDLTLRRTDGCVGRNCPAHSRRRQGKRHRIFSAEIDFVENPFRRKLRLVRNSRNAQ